MVVSMKFKAALKLGREPMYRVAQRAGINPNILSKLMSGIECPKPNDPRIVAVGRLLGLSPEECLDEVSSE